MTTFRGLGTLTRAGLLQSIRSGSALFWNFVFPLVWLFVFGFIFGRNDPRTVGILMPGLFTITLVSSAFFGVSYLMVSEREMGILRRYRVTPVTAPTIVIANSLRALAMMALSVTVQGTIGWLIFRFPMNGSLLLLVAMMMLGGAAFIPLGLLVGSIAPDMRSAPAISNLLFFPLVFLSGAALPFAMMPAWLQSLGRLVPSSYLVEGLHGVIVRGVGLSQLAGPIVVLLITMGVGAWLNSLLFRWESTEPVNRRNVAIAIAGLFLLFVLAAFLAPSFGMTQNPPID
jgi:ABC-2 type transport system permease protein